MEIYAKMVSREGDEVLWQVNQYTKYMQNYKTTNQRFGEDFK